MDYHALDVELRSRPKHPDARNRTDGRRLLEALKDLFAVIHGRDKHDSEAEFHSALEVQGY